MRRRGAVIVLAGALVVLGACSDDDSGSDDAAATSTTTEATEATDPPSTTAGETTTTSDPAATTTTSPNLAPSDSPLNELLVPPAAFGAGYAPDDTYGDGTFDGDLCEDVTIEQTWDDQAGQALSAGEASITQAVLRFADADAATGFVQELSDGVTTCDPNIVPEAIAGVGDEAARLGTSDEEGRSDRVVIRVGPLVTVATANTTDGSAPLLEDEVSSALVAALTA